MNEFEVYKVREEDEKKMAEFQFKNMIVDQALANIVLIKKEEMEEWTKKQEQLKAEMEEAQSKLESSLAEVRNKF